MHISKKSSVTKEQKPLCAWGLVMATRDLTKRFCPKCYALLSPQIQQELRPTEFHAIVKRGVADEVAECYGCCEPELILNTIKNCNLCRETYARHWKSVDDGRTVLIRDRKQRCNNWGTIREPDFEEDEDEEEDSTLTETEDNSDR